MKNFRVYRATKSGTGTASSWELSYKKDKEYDKYEMFLVMANQTGTDANGNASFGWDEGITVKLGSNDIGELISLLERRTTSLGYQGKGLYHQTAKGNKVLNLSLIDSGYGLKISAQDNDKNRTEIKQVISFGEASLLLVLLKRATEKIFGW